MSEKVPVNLDENIDNSLESLSDEEFVRKYPANGFGWGAIPNPENHPEVTEINRSIEAIYARHRELKRTRPGLYGHSSLPDNREYSPSNEEISNLLPDQLTRNLDGQVVNPRTNEPIRRGSPEDQELARRNMRPL